MLSKWQATVKCAKEKLNAARQDDRRGMQQWPYEGLATWLVMSCSVASL